MIFGNKPPYTTMQQLNLDWILAKLKTLLRLVPDNGAVGQILRRTRDGAEWSDETGGGGAVSSVNGQTGAVVLDAADVGALPDSYEAPVTSVNGETGEVTLDLGVTGILGYRDGVGEVTLKGLISMVGYSGVRIDSPSGNTIRFVCTKDTIGLGNVDNVRQYSASNPPPYPVRSVNGQTGAVVLDAADVGLANVDNVQQYSATNPPPYPVTSVNGQTGAVVIPTGGTEIAYEDVNLGSVTIASRSVEQVTGSVAKSGYTPIGVLYTNFPDTTVFILGRCAITGNNIDMYVYNSHASASRTSPPA